MSPHINRPDALARTIDLRPMLLALVFAALVLTALVLPNPARGLTLPLTSTDMELMSSRVILADVVAIRSHSDVTDGISTDVILHPVRDIKGYSAGDVVLSLPGGTVGGLTLLVSEAPRFVTGERVVVFLDRSGDVVAGRRGAFHVDGNIVAETDEPLAVFEARLKNRTSPAPSTETLGLDATEAATPSSVSALAVPSVAAISPPAAPAGIGAVVKIIGSGFGVKGAGSAVEFYYRSTTPIRATGSQIKSWTDTLVEVEVPTGIVDGYAASASSGPVTVVSNSGDRSSSVDFDVTFSYGGQKWPVAIQSFYVSENTADYAGEGTLLRNAASTWNAVSSFTLSSAGAATNPVSGNDRNEVWWANSGATGILAEARYWYWGTSLIEADVTFNDYYAWGTGSSANVYDIQSVALHEFGHWLALRDLYGADDSGKVMYGSIPSATQRRSLSGSDVQGIRWIYDGADVTPPETMISGIPSAWVTGTVTVTLEASDDESDPTTYYRIGSANIQTYTKPFAVSAEGESSVRYWSMDDAGNTETAQTAAVRIDRSPPTTSLSGAKTDYGTVTLTALGVDTGSGVAQTYYRIDGGTTRVGTRIVMSEEGAHTVQTWSVDALGHVEAARSATNARVLPVPDIDVSRVSGSNRFSTSVAVSSATFKAGSVRTAVLATGRQFADALSASALAGAYGGPLLLTDTSELPDEVATGAQAPRRRLGRDRRRYGSSRSQRRQCSEAAWL